MTKLNIQLETDKKPDATKRVKKAEQKKKDAEFEPTWEEVWNSGFTRPTGTTKKGIFQGNHSATDLKRLQEVKTAVEMDVLGVGVDNLKSFSKAHALRLYAELKEIKRKDVIKQMIETRPDNYYTVTGYAELLQVVDLLEEEDLIALDTETTGVKWEDVTVGMSITFPEADKHFYIPYGHNGLDEQLYKEDVMTELKYELEREGRKIVMFNSKFDVHMLMKDGINIAKNNYFDPMIAMHVLNENEPAYGLKPLSNKYGRYFGYTDESLGFSELFSKDPQDFINADIRIATIYACKDTHLTYLLYKWQLEHLEKQPDLYNMYFEIEQPITQVSVEMENNGLQMDVEYAEEYGDKLNNRILELEAIMKENWGDVNTNSPKQLKELLYDELGYKDHSGKGSTNAKVLKKLAKEHEDVSALLEYRDLTKMYNTYVKKLPKLIRKDVPEHGLKGDNRLHGQFNQTGTVTGRFSSDDPNLQNIPEGARELFVAPEGRYIIGIDYSQIEPRTLAHFSKDDKFSDPYINGGDLYVQIASDVYNIPYENCLEADDTYWREHTDLPKHPRDLAKVILLAVMYGISPYSLSDTLQTTPDQAEQFIQDFYESYPVVRAFMDKVVAFADEHGYVKTMFGRKRRFSGHTQIAKQYHEVAKRVKQANDGELPSNIWGSDVPYKLKQQYWNVSGDYKRVERQSVNAVIQGSASDILKRGMIQVYNHLMTELPDWKFLATIHDEILIEVPEDVKPEQIREIEALMQNTTVLDVPIKVDTEIMKRWGEGIPLQQWLDNGRTI